MRTSCVRRLPGKRHVSVPHSNVSMFICGAILSVLLSFTAFATTNQPMRIIGPVRLSVGSEEKVAEEVARTRQILTRFRNGGYEYAIWAVNRLPPKEEDIKKWTETCLQAFPTSPILAIDADLPGKGAVLDQKSLKVFLSTTLPKVDSVIVNFSHLNNCESSQQATEAIAMVKENIELVRQISPKTRLWLFLEDCPKSGGLIPKWTDELGAIVDGYYLGYQHGINASSDESLIAVTKQLLTAGKPVIRGGLMYTAARVRPGIEQDILEQYQERMTRYDKWISEMGYIGYSRNVGKEIPGDVNINMDFVPTTALVE